ncbi:MAG: chemotaxis response regulator protein-glutamate methylesterase [Acidobacteriia bacterium]|nr:chemotaxis response regulator protein-glutamate methylesterase [Terriglobia bacterium]
MMKTKVLIVDDSAVVRQLLTEILSRDPAIEVVGTASDPLVAREKVLRLQPDVLTLDVEMPRMDGLTFLEKLMRAHPMPVVMISSLTERGQDTTLRALELGAVDFVTKPKVDVAEGTVQLAGEIVEKVKAAAGARVKRPRELATPRVQKPLASAALARSTHQVIAVGASTGGTEALREFLEPLPADSPGIVIVQHMPEKFTRSFAERLDSLCSVRVKEAEDGDRILPGHALVAAGNYHVEAFRSGAEYRVRVFSGEPVNRHRPSVDVLFHSCAKHIGGNAVGVILTGMGADGARGLLEMQHAGARTIAQDEASCVVFGMPREAIALGAADEILPLRDIPAAALRLAANLQRA